MKLGDSGAAVGVLQGDLTSVGILTTRDKSYGPKTKASVEKFQSKYGLKVDGIAGPVTLSKLAQVKGGSTDDHAHTFGIDVSGWQPNTDWKKVAAGGVKFAYIKATEHTTFTNPLMKSDYDNAKANGIVVGFYHFFRPKFDGKAQAQHFLAKVKGRVAADDLPLCCDYETFGAEAGATPTETLKRIVDFQNEIEKAYGKKPMFYTMPAATNWLKNPAVLKQYPLWIAGPERASAPALKPWDTHTIWQYTFKGHFGGTTGQDGNYFNGSLAALKAFAQSTMVKPVEIPEVKPNPDRPIEVPVENTTASWMSWMAKHEGMNEANNSRELADLVWKHTTYTPGQKARTVTGKAFAWCAATVNAALENSGYKGNRSAAAKSFVTFGKECEIKPGAVIVIRHKGGGHHVTFFHHWVNEKKKLMACLGGNQSNALRISVYDVSGNAHGADQVVASRWPVTKLT